jgi:hypothetical protein
MSSNNPAYAAGVFDESGDARTTQGDAVVRAEIGALPSQIEYLGKLYPRRFTDCRTYLWGISAVKFLEWIRPHVVCSADMIDKALAVWRKRKCAKYEYQKLVRESARPLPGKTC